MHTSGSTPKREVSREVQRTLTEQEMVVVCADSLYAERLMADL